MLKIVTSDLVRFNEIPHAQLPSGRRGVLRAFAHSPRTGEIDDRAAPYGLAYRLRPEKGTANAAKGYDEDNDRGRRPVDPAVQIACSGRRPLDFPRRRAK